MASNAPPNPSQTANTASGLAPPGFAQNTTPAATQQQQAAPTGSQAAPTGSQQQQPAPAGSQAAPAGSQARASTPEGGSQYERGTIILKRPEAIVCDIEGTTTSVRFWEECLGPVIWLNCRECLKSQWDQQEVKDVFFLLKRQMKKLVKSMKHVYEIPEENTADAWIPQIFKYFRACTDQKRYSEDVISLQVLVAFYCYKNKICMGHVYDDAKNAFYRWKENNIRIGVFSSGISIVQQMLFYYSIAGDLTKIVTDYFSAMIDGSKNESVSFIRVARQMNIQPYNIVYVSDNIKELFLAKEAGFQPVLMVRSHNAEVLKLHKIPFRYIQNFDQLRFYEYYKQGSNAAAGAAEGAPPAPPQSQAGGAAAAAGGAAPQSNAQTVAITNAPASAAQQPAVKAPSTQS